MLCLLGDTLIFVLNTLGVQIVSIKNLSVSNFSGGVKNLHGTSHVIRSQVGIAHGHPDVLVSEQFLYRSNVHPAHHEPARKGVPQIVEPHAENACTLDCVP